MSSTYQRYKEARDAAWHALLHMKITTLPVDMDKVCASLRLEVHPFPTAAEEPKLYALLEKTGRPACVTLQIENKRHIFLRDRALSENERRFALAHELGHILLHHEVFPLSPGVFAFSGLENEGDLLTDPQDLDDYAADIFASRFLAPACVLHEIRADQPGQLRSVCGLPPRAAALRAERIQLLNARDAYFTSTAETQVRDQFLPFIRAQNHLPPPASAFPGKSTGQTPEKTPDEPENDPPEAPKNQKAVIVSASMLLLLAVTLIAASYLGLFPFLL